MGRYLAQAWTRAVRKHGRTESHRPGAQVTAILLAASRGEAAAGAKLMELVYDELRRLAASQMARTPPGNTLQPTALVHEAYFKLLGPRPGGGGSEFEGRAHFFRRRREGHARDILVDQARRKGAAKHGGGARRVDIEMERLPEVGQARDDLPDLDRALRKLEEELPRKAEIVMLRYFAGLTIEQVAEVLGVTERTVNRDWLFAKAWLQRELEAGEQEREAPEDE